MDEQLLAKMVETSVKLDRALQDLKEIKEKQETNHLVAVALREHQTIERVDSLWVKMGEMTFLFRLSIGLLSLAGAVAGIIYVIHAVWHWP